LGSILPRVQKKNNDNNNNDICIAPYSSDESEAHNGETAWHYLCTTGTGSYSDRHYSDTHYSHTFAWLLCHSL